jgi:hypothetical protein
MTAAEVSQASPLRADSLALVGIAFEQSRLAATIALVRFL